MGSLQHQTALVTGAAKRIGKASPSPSPQPAPTSPSPGATPRPKPRDRRRTPGPSASAPAGYPRRTPLPPRAPRRRRSRRRRASAASTSSSTTPDATRPPPSKPSPSSSGTPCSRPTPARPSSPLRPLYPYLKAAHGRIINIGSLGGLHPWPTHAHYCTSKAALHMLTRTMSKAWAPEISVNCVAPGMIVTTEKTRSRTGNDANSNTSPAAPPCAATDPPKTSPTPSSFSPPAPTSSPARFSPSTAASASNHFALPNPPNHPIHLPRTAIPSEGSLP